MENLPKQIRFLFQSSAGAGIFRLMIECRKALSQSLSKRQPTGLLLKRTKLSEIVLSVM